MIAAVLICTFMLFVAITGIFLYLERVDARMFAAHAPGRHARQEFADPADDSDPYGEKFIAELHHDHPALAVSGSLPMLTREECEEAAARFAPPGSNATPRQPGHRKCTGGRAPLLPHPTDTGSIPHAVGTLGHHGEGARRSAGREVPGHSAERHGPPAATCGAARSAVHAWPTSPARSQPAAPARRRR